MAGHSCQAPLKTTYEMLGMSREQDEPYQSKLDGMYFI